MEFHEAKLGMVIETDYNNRYEIVGLNHTSKTVDLKYVGGYSGPSGIGQVYEKWPCKNNSWKLISTPHVHLTPVSGIDIDTELGSTAKYLDEVDAEVDGILAQMYNNSGKGV